MCTIIIHDYCSFRWRDHTFYPVDLTFPTLLFSYASLVPTKGRQNCTGKRLLDIPEKNQGEEGRKSRRRPSDLNACLTPYRRERERRTGKNEPQSTVRLRKFWPGCWDGPEQRLLIWVALSSPALACSRTSICCAQWGWGAGHERMGGSPRRSAESVGAACSFKGRSECVHQGPLLF